MVIEMTPRGTPLTDGAVVEPVPLNTQPAPVPEPVPSDMAWRESPDPEGDAVDPPVHYADGRRYEPIDVIEDWDLGFHLGNAVKYIARCGRKEGEDPSECLRKAVWYLEREIARRERR